MGASSSHCHRSGSMRSAFICYCPPFTLQVILGDNLLAQDAVAGKPTDKWHSAAAHDLDQLQRLAVSERTLAGWIKDIAGAGASDEWLKAASSLVPEEPSAATVPQGTLFPDSQPPLMLAPLTKAQRAGLRAELAGKCKWSENVDLLVQYHAAHGRGLIAAFSMLSWTGKLQAQVALKGATQGGPQRGQLMHYRCSEQNLLWGRWLF